MAKLNVRFLTKRPGRNGLPRYFWQPGRSALAEGAVMQRIPDNPDTYLDPDQLEAAAFIRAHELNKEFDAARAARQGNPVGTAIAARAAPGRLKTIDDAIRDYRASRYFTQLRDSTKRTYIENLDIIAAWSGDAPVRAIDAKRVEKFYMSMQPTTPTKANHVVAMLRVLLSHATTGKLKQPNAASFPGLIGVAPSGVIWPQPAVDLFVKTADDMGIWSIGTAVMFNNWIGQREGDVLTMKPPRLANGALIFRQSKRGAGVMLPIAMVPDLAARLAEELKRRDEQKIVALPTKEGGANALPLILDERTGRPYTRNTFPKRFAEVRAEMARQQIARGEPPCFPVDYIPAGSSDEDAENPVIRTEKLLFMHLRHTAVVRLAEAEADDRGISATTGQSLASINRILKHYLVRTGELVRVAFAKRLAKQVRDQEAGEG